MVRNTNDLSFSLSSRYRIKVLCMTQVGLLKLEYRFLLSNRLPISSKAVWPNRQEESSRPPFLAEKSLRNLTGMYRHTFRCHLRNSGSGVASYCCCQSVCIVHYATFLLWNVWHERCLVHVALSAVTTALKTGTNRSIWRWAEEATNMRRAGKPGSMLSGGRISQQLRALACVR